MTQFRFIVVTDPQPTNKHTQTDRGDYNTLRSLACSVIRSKIELAGLK